MKKIRVKNTASVPIGGLAPGGEIFLATKADGKTPADIYWRKRLADEAKYKSGHLEIVKDAPAPKKKGEKVDG